MGRLLKIRYSFLLLSSIFFETAFAEVPCQRGVDYKNSCNPYDVQFIKLNKSGEAGNKQVVTKAPKKASILSRSYLNRLLDKYSSRYDGRSGLQALIDRSKYGANEKSSKKPPKKIIATKQVIEHKVKQKKSDLNKTTQRAKSTLVESTPKKSTAEMVATKPNPQIMQIVKSNTEKLMHEKNVTKQVAAVEPSEQTTKSVENQHITSSKAKVKQTEKNRTKLSVNTVKEPTKSTYKVAKVKKVKKVLKAKIKPKKEIKYPTYIVRKGDTLISIAKNFLISKKVLVKLNKLNSNGTIKLNQALKFPQKYARKIKKFGKEIAYKKSVKKQNKKGIYVVGNGDTLSHIAKRTNLSIIQLREFNRIARSSKIKVGQKLLLKAPKIVKRKSRNVNYIKNIKFTRSTGMKFKRKLRVTATAYTSHRSQTDSTPFLAAWNNRIRPGMKIIAVSRDLISKHGLKNGSRVRIGGLKGFYTVRDKMNKRFRRRIDIYMGSNKRKALRWGRRYIALYW